MSFTFLLAIIAIGCIIDTLIGAWIGSTKRRTSMGSTLGLLLGPFGWLIIALLPGAKFNKVFTPAIQAHFRHIKIESSKTPIKQACA